MIVLLWLHFGFILNYSIEKPSNPSWVTSYKWILFRLYFICNSMRSTAVVEQWSIDVVDRNSQPIRNITKNGNHNSYNNRRKNRNRKLNSVCRLNAYLLDMLLFIKFLFSFELNDAYCLLCLQFIRCLRLTLNVDCFLSRNRNIVMFGHDGAMLCVCNSSFEFVCNI